MEDADHLLSLSPRKSPRAALAGAVFGAGCGASRLGAAALHLLLPPQCLICRKLVSAPGALCAACWRGIDFIEGPSCAVCGLPFDYEIGDNAHCAACLHWRPLYDRARAVMRYDDGALRLIVGFKHRDRIEGAKAFAAWMAQSGAELIEQSDLIAPVPLHWTRLIRRRYSQAALLGQALAKRTQKPLIADLLIRTRRTPSQGGRNAAERRRNVRGAIAVRRRHQAALAGKRVLLMTTCSPPGQRRMPAPRRCAGPAPTRFCSWSSRGLSGPSHTPYSGGACGIGCGFRRPASCPPSCPWSWNGMTRWPKS